MVSDETISHIISIMEKMNTIDMMLFHKINELEERISNLEGGKT